MLHKSVAQGMAFTLISWQVFLSPVICVGTDIPCGPFRLMLDLRSDVLCVGADIPGGPFQLVLDLRSDVLCVGTDIPGGPF